MIGQVIHQARAFEATYGTSLRNDPEVQGLLGAYRRAIDRTYETMEEDGVVTACSRCAQGPSGSCCFEGVEDWYDPVLLLINLLLDVELPSRREIPDACFFVGQGGCKLRGRYAFCVNFLCPKIGAEVKNGNLLRATGEELLRGWELEKAVRRRIAPGTGGSLAGQEIRP